MKDFFLTQLPSSLDPRALLIKSRGALGRSFADIIHAWNMQQNKFHIETLWEHMVDCYCIALTYTQDPILSMACFFHDIGKIETKEWDEEKQDWTFHKHEVEGALIVCGWMDAERFTSKQIDRVYRVIRHHQFRFYPRTHDGTIKKWLEKIGHQCWEDVRLLRLMDRMATQSTHPKLVLCKKLIQIDNRVSVLADSLWK